MSEDTYTGITDPKALAQLEQPIDPRRIKHRQGGGGVQLAYLKGHDVIDAANRIFGYGSWGYEILDVTRNDIPGPNGVEGCFYSARVKVTVANCVPVTEEGVCAVQEGRNPRAKIDSHDMARKGAITDALKRGLRTFGDQFGNSLYDTDVTDGQTHNQQGQVISPRVKAHDAAEARAERLVQAANAPTPIINHTQRNSPATDLKSLKEHYFKMFEEAETVEALNAAWSACRVDAGKLSIDDDTLKAEVHPAFKKRYYVFVPAANPEYKASQPAKVAR